MKLDTLPHPDHKGFRPWYGRPKRPYAYNGHRVLEKVAPFGYTLTFEDGLERWDIAGDRFAELNYLIQTQDQELAPSWLEMIENGLQAVSIDQQREDLDGDMPPIEPSTEDLPLTGDGFDGTIWDIPSRREQELAEWERYTWHCGPVVKGHYESDGRRLSFVLDSVREVGSPTNLLFRMSDEWKQNTIRAIVRQHAQEGLLPDPAELARKRNHMIALREEWGRNWAKEATRGVRRQFFLDDPDPFRYGLMAEDNERARNPYMASENADYLAAYTGSGAIGWDDGDEVDPSMYWDND